MAQPGYVHQEFPKYLHHPTGEHPSKIVHDEDEENALLAEWGLEKRDADAALDPFRHSLMVRAEKLGVTVNPRWGDPKLEQEVHKAEAKKR